MAGTLVDRLPGNSSLYRGLDRHAEPAPALACHRPVADPSCNHDPSLFRDDYDAMSATFLLL